jgi:hypothetical protein
VNIYDLFPCNCTISHYFSCLGSLEQHGRLRLQGARVAELADAQDLKSCEGNLVRVRVPPRAHFASDNFLHNNVVSMNAFVIIS